MKNGRDSVEDGITAAIMKMGVTTEAVTIVMNKCLQSETIPEYWQSAQVILLHKKETLSPVAAN